VANETSIADAVDQARESFGGVDILINNAVAPIRKFNSLDVPEEEWERTATLNVRAPYLFMRLLVPDMIARGGGAIVNITSGAAGTTIRGTLAHDGYLAYGVSKAALERLTTFFAAEYRDRNIAVNAISPGHVSRYVEDGRQPDLHFWGDPIVHLVSGIEAELTGRILHTYGFGCSWGPVPATAPQWDGLICSMLRDAGFADPVTVAE
jgi:NAD(P)-dependent dehydrogenase (short-subunit alcohol dehydrogenase family)